MSSPPPGRRVIGERVSHYTIIRRLGGGGMGVVFKAEDERLKRPVALKFLPPEMTRDEAAKARLLLEAQAASALDHPHVCAVHEIDETPDGQVFICMAYVDGESLKSRLERGPLPVEDAIVIGLQIAEGLAHAHRHGIIHRDIKPANVMLARDGGVKLVDFGLATLVGQTQPGAPGTVAGTPAYMSPEQVRGVPVDERSDIWALGAVLFEMLAGRPLAAVREDAGAETRGGISATLAGARPDVPPQLAAITARCIARDPAGRYQSAAELVADLDCVRRTLRIASQPTLTSAPAAARRPRRRLGLAVLAVVSLAALAAAVLWHPGVRALLHPERTPDQKVLAVLPFANVGGDPGNQRFCDGLPESLTSRLTQLQRYRVWVVPFSDVRAKHLTSPTQARDGLGVNLAVTGFVQRNPGDVRVTLNLNRVDGPTPRQIRSVTIDESVAELYRLEDRSVWALAEMLDLELPRAAQRTPLPGGTTVAEAQDLYLRGLGALYPGAGAPDAAAAAELFRRAAALDRRFSLAWAGLGQAYLAEYQTAKDPGLVTQAIAAGDTAAGLDPGLPQVHLTLATIRLTKGDAQGAVREFELVLQANPTDAAALRGLAKAFETLGRFGDAEAAYARAIAAQPGLWASYQALAQFYWHRSRYPEAEATYRHALALDPGNEWIANNLGALLFTVGRYDEARAMFERSLALRPTYAAYSNCGTLAFMQKRWTDAIAQYEKAAALDSGEYVVWGNTGIAYHWLGHDVEARDALLTASHLAERQLAVNPNDPSVLADLASYSAVLGEAAQARAFLARIEDVGRTQADLAIAIADVRADLGEKEQAIEWIGIGVGLGFPAADLAQRPAFASLLRDPRLQALLRPRPAPVPDAK